MNSCQEQNLLGILRKPVNPCGKHWHQGIILKFIACNSLINNYSKFIFNFFIFFPTLFDRPAYNSTEPTSKRKLNPNL